MKVLEAIAKVIGGTVLVLALIVVVCLVMAIPMACTPKFGHGLPYNAVRV